VAPGLGISRLDRFIVFGRADVIPSAPSDSKPEAGPKWAEAHKSGYSKNVETVGWNFPHFPAFIRPWTCGHSTEIGL